MARIVYITENWQASEELITSIAACGHEVQVWTGQTTEIEFTPKNIQILQPFKTWSVLDIAKLIPLTFNFRPEMIHLIPPTEKSARWYSLWTHLDIFFKNITPTPTLTTGATLTSLTPSLDPSPLEELFQHFFTAYIENLSNTEKFLEMIKLLKEKRPELHVLLFANKFTHFQKQRFFKQLKFWKLEDRLTLRQWNLNEENLRLILQGEAFLTINTPKELSLLMRANLRVLDFHTPVETYEELLKPHPRPTLNHSDLLAIDESVNQINRLYAQALQSR